MAPEVLAMKRWLVEQLIAPDGGVAVDLGCGNGYDLRILLEANPRLGRLIGVDRSEVFGDHRESGHFEFVAADLSIGIPLPDSSVDAIYSVNLLECLPDPRAFVAECARVLKPGGSIVLAHFDWDTQTFDGEDRTLVRKLVHAYNDWQQAWMGHIDPWAGRRIHRLFAENQDFAGEVRANTLMSNSFSEGSYGRRQAESFEALVRRNVVSQSEFDSFMSHQRQLGENGIFSYSVTMYVFVGIRTNRA